MPISLIGNPDGDTGLPTLAAMDRANLVAFVSACRHYVRLLGVNSVSVIWATHEFGFDLGKEVYTAHILVNGADQSLFVCLVFDIENIHKLSEILDQELMLSLIESDFVSWDGGLLFDKQRVAIEETITIFDGSDRTEFEITNVVPIVAEEGALKALIFFEELCDAVIELDESDPAVEVKRTITIYAISDHGLSVESFDSCVDVIISVDAESEPAKLACRELILRARMDCVDFPVFSQVIASMCEDSENLQFVNFNFRHSTAGEFIAAVTAHHAHDDPRNSWVGFVMERLSLEAAIQAFGSIRPSAAGAGTDSSEQFGLADVGQAFRELRDAGIAEGTDGTDGDEGEPPRTIH